MGSIVNRLIVVPIDMSEFSMKAFRAALEIAKDSSQIRILHVLPILEPSEPGVIWNDVDNPTRIEQSSEALKQYFKDQGYTDISIEIRLGDPGTEIANYAQQIEAGLIVIPSHGRGMLQRLLLGSTTDRVVHLAHCPVLVLKKNPSTAKKAKSDENAAEITGVNEA